MMNMMNPMMGMMGALARACGLIPRVAPGLHLLFLINMEPGILFGDPFGFHAKKAGIMSLVKPTFGRFLLRRRNSL